MSTVLFMTFRKSLFEEHEYVILYFDKHVEESGVSLIFVFRLSSGLE